MGLVEDFGSLTLNGLAQAVDVAGHFHQLAHGHAVEIADDGFDDRHGRNLEELPEKGEPRV